MCIKHQKNLCPAHDVLFHDTCHILEYISVLKIEYQGVFVILPLMYNTLTDN